MSLADVPVVDLAAVRSAEPATRRAAGEAALAGFRSVGLCFLHCPGRSPAPADAVYDAFHAFCCGDPAAKAACFAFGAGSSVSTALEPELPASDMRVEPMSFRRR